jgi:hypothetical protein
LEAVGEHACILHAGSNSLDELALYVALKGFDFQVLDPPGLVGVLRTISDRLRRAADASLRAAQLADVPDSDTGPPRDEPGQVGRSEVTIITGLPDQPSTGLIRETGALYTGAVHLFGHAVFVRHLASRLGRPRPGWVPVMQAAARVAMSGAASARSLSAPARESKVSKLVRAARAAVKDQVSLPARAIFAAPGRGTGPAA